jgi:hypothetical protein
MFQTIAHLLAYYKTLNVFELQQCLKEFGLSIHGKEQDLIDRLVQE